MNKNNFKTRFGIDIFLLIILFFILNSNFNLKYFYTKNSIIIVIIWYLISRFFSLYTSHLLISFAQELIRLFKTMFVFSILLISLIFIAYHNYQYKVKFFIFIYICVLSFVFSWVKYFYRIYSYKLRKNKHIKQEIITIGINNLAHYQSELNINYLNYNFIPISLVNNLESVEQIKRIESILKNTYPNISEVLIGKNRDTISLIDDLVNLCEGLDKKIYFLNESDFLVSNDVQFNNFIGLQKISFQYYPLNEYENRVIKRAFDICCSIIFLIFFYWEIYILIAIFIKMTSKGKIMFKQQRWGLNNKSFNCYKFRTMYSDSPEIDKDGHYIQTTNGDDRVTRIGRFLRKTSLDELPQIWNVFKGNMSLVGPRPHPIALNEESMDKVTNYIHRHLVKPGITGWAQVNGFRGETKNTEEMQKRIDFDIWYIQHWRLEIDVQIILQTIINLIKGDKKAY